MPELKKKKSKREKNEFPELRVAARYSQNIPTRKSPPRLTLSVRVVK